MKNFMFLLLVLLHITSQPAQRSIAPDAVVVLGAIGDKTLEWQYDNFYAQTRKKHGFTRIPRPPDGQLFHCSPVSFFSQFAFSKNLIVFMSDMLTISDIKTKKYFKFVIVTALSFCVNPKQCLK